ncbi:acyl-CoA/acyl-ACP dehydrogenase [Pseudomonas sp. 21LCFQ02]|uniref:acyl-CoA dehydrogenase family protein n=1 Tax=Pseudomonas sp. 21LCFQ02 TaxID=2957505 RepID=UPI00209B0446|nr:acyl-CoA dehydrogenase family protein [Pseudomonas sp. 21LCFQ02]MCO8167513.1 acyl-CoA/acyl-ACP dehydrogenase [Pseudomonas sp. 21LCFQ02]
MSQHLHLNDALPQIYALADDFRKEGERADSEGIAPKASLEQLHARGLLHITHSASLGGPDGSLKGKQPELFLNMLRAICRADSAAGHCFQLHNHALWQLEEIGTPEQIELFVKPALQKCSIFSAVGSEPGRVNMYEMKTRAQRVDGGWLVNGVKNFVTNGTIADLILTSVALEGVEGYLDNLQIMLIRPDMPGVTWDDAWYQPHGMRGARSPIMRLENVFVPDNHLLGEPGAFARQRWQGRFHLGFAANYLGTSEGLFDWYLEYQRGRNKGNDPYTQLRVGEVKMKLDAAAAMFESAIQSWRHSDVVQAELRSMSAKSTAAHTAFDALQSVLLSAGATAQFEEHPLGRTVRNIETFVVHAGHDRTAQIIGQAQLGASFDSTLQR